MRCSFESLSRTAALVLLTGCSLQSMAQATGIDVIQAYAGTWKTETEHFDTAYSKAGKESSTLHNDCWKSGEFYACHQIVNGESKALIVFTYDPKTRTYTTYPVTLEGRPAGHGKLVIEGNVWTYPWDDTENGKATHFRVVNTFTAPNRIEFRQEYSTDNQNWTVMAKGVEVKQ
ncbi:MAG: hypothetical protein JOZ83_15505 [Silvibacterium sp.]|nr:hypothetical protein [Silvibacterium sp.]